MLGVTNPITKEQTVRVCAGCWVIHSTLLGDEASPPISRSGSYSRRTQTMNYYGFMDGSDNADNFVSSHIIKAIR